MPLISDDYKDLNRLLHESNPNYGTSGSKSAKFVVELANTTGLRDILDYGCGKGTLGQVLNIDIKEFDPCIEGKDAPPQPADIVVCTDVLEHIEPNCLEDVLNDLQRLTKHTLLLVISTRPAMKKLADGRNAHLIIEPIDYWLPKLMLRWELDEFKSLGNCFKIVLNVKKSD